MKLQGDCVFPFTQSMLITHYCNTIPNQQSIPVHLPPVIKKNHPVIEAWREWQCMLLTASQTLPSLPHTACITQLHSYNKLQTWVRITNSFLPIATEHRIMFTACRQQKCQHIQSSYFEVQAMQQQGRNVLDLVPAHHCHDGDGCHPKNCNH
jgi:hypothetical protein